MKNAPSWKKLYENKKNKTADVKSIEKSDDDMTDVSCGNMETIANPDSNTQVG
jgi:hypothetical protein